MKLLASNIYYFKRICNIGGIEQFFNELAKRYGINGKCIDLVIVYNEADPIQLARLRKNVKCVRYEQGMIIECKRAFFNFNIEIIDNVIAEEYTLVVHGNYHFLPSKPPTHEKITKVIAVSKDSAKAYTELTGVPCDVCYNPIAVEPPQRILRLVTACRLEDYIKGGYRTQKLIEALDKYCEEHNTLYTMTIFSNSVNVTIDSPNVVIRKPRIDVRNFIADADYVMQLSDNYEGYCYTVNEALLYGVPVIITPCDVYSELGINEKMSIVLNFDMSNIDKVVEDIFTRTFKFKYEPPKDIWDELLVLDPSDYLEEAEKMYKVIATKNMDNIYDKESKTIRHEGDVFEASYERMNMLLGDNKYNIKYVERVTK